jgi:hypothetical protein
MDGEPMAPEDLALIKAINHHIPAHEKIRITSADGTSRAIAVTALPLFARRDEYVGAVAVFWEHESESKGRAGG